MSERLLVAVLFGGRSVEHEVSIRSARSVLRAVDEAGHESLPVAVGTDGHWFTSTNPLGVFGPTTAESKRLPVRLGPVPGEGLWLADSNVRRPDCYFPLIHGAGGEDGTLQGLFELAEVAYAGPGPLASALAMDKVLCKKVLQQAGLPVLPGEAVSRYEWQVDREAVLRRVRDRMDGEVVVFVKPSNGGSSVGITRVGRSDSLADALETALSFDRVALVEPAVDAREIEVGVLGNDEPHASIPGEIEPARLFYDYRAKYEDERTRLRVPAPIEASLAEQLRVLAVAAFRAVGACGMGRVDFLVERATSAPWLSELNTLPGFTDISMYPRLWEATGIAYPDLVDQIITLGCRRHQARQSLRRAPHDSIATRRLT